VKLRCCWQLLDGQPVVLLGCSAACEITAEFILLLLLPTAAIAVTGRKSRLLDEAIKNPVAGGAGRGTTSA
jgi:hypothetical protein